MKSTHTRNTPVFSKKIIPLLSLAAFISLNSQADIVNVYNGEDLQAALKSASAGDEIVLQPGSYRSVPGTATAGEKDSHFYSAANGNASNRITIRSASASNPQTLEGDTTGSKKVLYITGDYWTIKNIKVTNGKKGILLDNSNYSIIDNVTVFNIGEEAIHLRDNSSNNIVRNSRVYDTGLVTPGTGEAFYVGSDPKSGATYGYGLACNNNVIGGNIIGPGITAEHIDIKEGTSGTIFEYNTMDGRGISAANSADSFIDIKGNKAVIRGNKAFRNGESNVINAFEFHGEVTSNEATFIDNQGDLDGGSGSLIYAHQGTAHVSSNNKRTDGGNTLTSKTSRATIDSNIPSGIPAPGNYTGVTPTSSAAASSKPASSVPASSKPASSAPASSKAASSAPSTGGGCSSTTNIAWDSKLEVTVANGSCVKFSQNLSGKTLQAWDSDTNSCDFKGSLTSVNGSGSLNVTSTYVASTSLTGTTFKVAYAAGSSCQYVKLRAY